MKAKTETALLIARTLMAILFFVAGTRKLLTFGATLGYFGHLGIPLPQVVLPLTIAFEIGASIALVAGWRLHVVGPLLAIFTIAAGVLGHPFWAVEAPQFNAQLNNFMKNLAIAGAFIALGLPARSPKAGARPQ